MTALLVVITGPGGVGKDTLIEMLRQRDPRLTCSVSYTTRPRREHEMDGEHYRFVDEPTFWRLEADGELIEHARVNRHLYGTSASRVAGALGEGHDVILEIDVRGAEQVRERRPDAVLVYISAPSLAEADTAWGPRYNHVVRNDDAERAAGEILAILERERGKRGEPARAR